MAAKDYEICPALGAVYFGKRSKRNPEQMTKDRREITEEEIMLLIDWWLNKSTTNGGNGVMFPSHLKKDMKILVKFTDK